MADAPNAFDTVAAIPFYKSPVQIANVTAFLSAAIALFPKIGAALGIKSAAEVSAWVTTLFGFIALAAPLAGGIFRAKSKVQPLTLTAAKAEVHPNTVAHMAATGETPPLPTKEPT